MKKNYQIPETLIINLGLVGSILEDAPGEFSGTADHTGNLTNEVKTFEEDDIPTGTSSSLWD